jgi:LytS/YehU family sensor histidine kinase
MLIQPYIENAIGHGLQPMNEEGVARLGTLHITFSAQERCLLCEIEDNGIGRDRAWERSHGSSAKGLSMSTKLVEERLQLLGHFHEASVEAVYTDLVDKEHQPLGTRISLLIPLFSQHSPQYLEHLEE